MRKYENSALFEVLLMILSNFLGYQTEFWISFHIFLFDVDYFCEWISRFAICFAEKNIHLFFVISLLDFYFFIFILDVDHHSWTWFWFFFLFFLFGEKISWFPAGFLWEFSVVFPETRETCDLSSIFYCNRSWSFDFFFFFWTGVFLFIKAGFWRWTSSIIRRTPLAHTRRGVTRSPSLVRGSLLFARSLAVLEFCLIFITGHWEGTWGKKNVVLFKWSVYTLLSLLKISLVLREFWFVCSHPVEVSDSKAGAELLDIILMKVFTCLFCLTCILEICMVILWLLSMWKLIWIDRKLLRNNQSIAFVYLRAILMVGEIVLSNSFMMGHIKWYWSDLYMLVLNIIGGSWGGSNCIPGSIFTTFFLWVSSKQGCQPFNPRCPFWRRET